MSSIRVLKLPVITQQKTKETLKLQHLTFRFGILKFKFKKFKEYATQHNLEISSKNFTTSKHRIADGYNQFSIHLTENKKTEKLTLEVE